MERKPVRCTGLFKSKKNAMLATGFVKGEALQKMFDEVKLALEEGQLSVFMWKNDSEANKPIASLTVMASAPGQQRSGGYTKKKNTDW